MTKAKYLIMLFVTVAFMALIPEFDSKKMEMRAWMQLYQLIQARKCFPKVVYFFSFFWFDLKFFLYPAKFYFLAKNLYLLFVQFLLKLYHNN